MLTFTSKAATTEVPFIQLPTGQILVEVDLMGKAEKQYFIIETSGTNLIRGDMNQRLDLLGIDTTSAFLKFPEIKIGQMSFTHKNNFRAKKALGKRSEYAFPPSVLGTLGPKFFGKKVLQFDFQKKILKITDTRDELELAENTPYVYFTQSFTNAVPVIDVQSAEISDCDVYLNVSLAMGINFPVSAMSTVVQYAGNDEKKTYQISLDGKKHIVYTAIEAPKIYLNNEVTLSNIEITFTDELMPAIGNSFLQHFLTTIDFNDGILFLAPSTEKGREMMANHTVKPIKK